MLQNVFHLHISLDKKLMFVLSIILYGVTNNILLYSYSISVIISINKCDVSNKLHVVSGNI